MFARVRFLSSAFSSVIFRLPVFLFVLLTVGVLVTVLPAATGDTTADHVIGQIDFAHSTANFVDNKGISLSSAPGGVAVDSSGHVYVVDPDNNRVLGYDLLANLNNTSGAPTALKIFGQPDQFSNLQNNGGIGSNTMWSPSGVA